MILDARAANCFSSTCVLKVNERPIGKFESQWFSESLDIHLTERRHLQFRKTGWLGSQFELVDLADEQLLGQCDRGGLFTSSWNVHLSTGPGQLVHAGWFQTAYEFAQDNEVLARVDRLSWCERGWTVDGANILTVEDHLLIGLVYHVIQKRANQQHNAGGHAAGS